MPEFTSDLARSGAISRPLRPRPRLGLSLFADEPDRTRSAPFWAGLSTGRISWIAVRVRLGAQVPRAQSSGGDWSKPATSVSSSQGSEAKPDVRAGVSGGALGGKPIDSRIRFAIVGSVIAAITRIEWPHSHRRASTPKIRWSKSAQGTASDAGAHVRLCFSPLARRD